MQFSIMLNLLSARGFNFPLDIEHLFLLTLLQSLQQVKEYQKEAIKDENGDLYFWFSAQKIVKDAPILLANVGKKSNTEYKDIDRAKLDKVRRMIDNLVDSGYMLPNPNNKKLAKSFYTFTEKASLLINCPDEKNQEFVSAYGNNRKHLTETTVTPYVNDRSPLTEKNVSISNTNDNSNYNQEKEPLTLLPNGKNKPKNKCDVQPIPTCVDTPQFVEAWAQLLETKKWRTKEVSAINLALKKLSAYDVAFAIQLVETAIMGGYQGVVFSDTPTAYEKWQKTKQANLQVFQQPHPNFPQRPLYINLFADRWAKVKWWRTSLAELENGQDKEFSFAEISKMLQYTEPLNILK